MPLFFLSVGVQYRATLGIIWVPSSEHWQEKRRQTKNNMEEDNNIRAMAREKEADQEQHGGGQ
jgi:hypothetical protein